MIGVYIIIMYLWVIVVVFFIIQVMWMLSAQHRRWLIGTVVVLASIRGLWNLSDQIVSGAHTH